MMKKEITWIDKLVVISSNTTELENAKSVIERLCIKVNLGSSERPEYNKLLIILAKSLKNSRKEFIIISKTSDF